MPGCLRVVRQGEEHVLPEPVVLFRKPIAGSIDTDWAKCTGGDVQGAKEMDIEIAADVSAVLGVTPPLEQTGRFEGDLSRPAEESIPIDIGGRSVWGHEEVHRTTAAHSIKPAFDHVQLPDGTALDQFCNRPVNHRSGVLAADLGDFSTRLPGVDDRLAFLDLVHHGLDRKSTRLNSSHLGI